MFERRPATVQQVLLVFAIGTVAAASAVPPKKAAVALLPEPTAFRTVVAASKGDHEREYDGAFDVLGWPKSSFAIPKGETAGDDFFAALKAADLLLLCPLAQDFLSGRIGEMREWLEGGGVIHAGGFTTRDFAKWLTALGEEYRPLEIWGDQGWSTPRQRDLDPPDSLRVFPRCLADTDQGVLWTNFRPPEAGSAWRVVSTRISANPRADGRPNIVRAPVGKGWIILSNIRTPAPEWVENLRALAELARRGLSVEASAGFPVRQGKGSLSLALKGDAAATKGLQLVMEVIPQEGADEDQDDKPDAAQSFRAVAGKADGNGVVRLALDYYNAARGECRVIVRVGRGGDWATVLDETRRFPRLVEIDPPNYRGMVSVMRRDAAVKLPFSFNPLMERVEGAKLDAVVETVGERGTAVWKKRLSVAALAGKKTLDLALAANAPAGAYRLRTRLMRPGKSKPLFTNEVAFAIREAKPYQTMIDQDGVLLRGGKPWFPLGIFHAKPDEAAQWSPIGFNAAQFWSWDDFGDAIEGLHRERGIDVVYEGAQDQHVRKHATNPGVAMWYLADEPALDRMKEVRQRNEMLHQDLERPTFIVGDQETRGAVAMQLAYGDVVAADSYPIWPDRKDPTKMSGDVMDVWRRVQTAGVVADGRRPVMAVLQSFGHEPMEHLRAMAFLSLAEGVKGIFWYCWKQVGGGKVGEGLVNSSECQERLKTLVGEIRPLTTALMAGGESFGVANTQVRGRIFGDAKTGRHLLLVNGSPDAAEVKVALPSLAKRRVGKTVVGDAAVSVKGGVVEATLPGLAVVVVR